MKVTRTGLITEPTDWTDDIWQKLLLEHEPGKRRKVGRPRNWRKDIALIIDVNRLKLERSRSDSEAIHVLTTSQRFAGRWSGENELTLRNRLSAARKDRAIEVILERAQGLGVDLSALVDQTDLIKKRGGPTPNEAKAADNAEKKPETVAAQPPKPPKPKAEKPEEEATRAEREALALARAMFQ
ncbi:hypothetical protein [Mesorhizobium kowhaii]|uniref:Uncharacterized protein n=1 Tax=Mesorhizobium kowhaii TaxID=1300272 RepID=A0A2W7C0N3_9HYPH|nr:hypothetical protein [Mesorhizobium kowhaii]PZV36477.1 hypothetical protein B5V02_22130 [Mesorhizobium kowhaii]